MKLIDKVKAILSILAIILPLVSVVYYYESQHTNKSLVDQFFTVEGPLTATEGQLVLLKTNATKSLWVHDLQQVIECQDQIAFVAERGVNTVWLVYESDGELHRLKHTIEVVQKVDTSPEPPESPRLDDEPRKDNQSQFNQSSLIEAARALEDGDTISLLVVEWKAAIGGIRGSPSLETAKQLLRQANDAAFSKRTSFSSRYKDWLGKFRQPLTDEIERLILKGDIKAPNDLAKYVEQLITALQ